MNQEHIEKNTSQEEVWLGDYFGRKADANYLTRFLVNGFQDKRYRNQSFVLNLNAGWGFGKTYFLNNWAMDLRHAGHLVVSFDAWKNDYSEDALLSFISEVSNDLHDQIRNFENKSAADEMIEKALNVAVAIPVIATKIAAAMLSGDKKDALNSISSDDFNKSIDIGDFSGDRKKLLSILASNALKENNEKREAVKEFVASAERFVDAVSSVQGSQSLPVFFFIDELDRCRPDFAIKLLESIKHIFPVKGFCFVIATDTYQLSQSIKAVYGNEFEANTYLKRFFDMEYSFPDPGLNSIASALFSSSDISCKLFIPNDIFQGKNAVFFFSEICSCFNLSPRGVYHVFDVLYACCAASTSRKLHLALLLPLICLKYLYPSAFDQLSFSRDTETFRKVIADIGCENQLKSISSSVSFHNCEGRLEMTDVSLFRLIGSYFEFLRISGADWRSGNFYDKDVFRSLIDDLFSLPIQPREGYYYSDAFSYFDRVKMAGNFSSKTN